MSDVPDVPALDNGACMCAVAAMTSGRWTPAIGTTEDALNAMARYMTNISKACYGVVLITMPLTRHK